MKGYIIIALLVLTTLVALSTQASIRKPGNGNQRRSIFNRNPGNVQKRQPPIGANGGGLPIGVGIGLPFGINGANGGYDYNGNQGPYYGRPEYSNGNQGYNRKPVYNNGRPVYNNGKPVYNNGNQGFNNGFLGGDSDQYDDDCFYYFGINCYSYENDSK